jgi:two-component system phosphate regulon response regulator PhoB
MGTTARVLIVESDTTNAEDLWMEVRQAGHEPLIAFSIEKANSVIEQDHPQVVLLRWKLHDASGLSLLNDLRTNFATRRLPVIVLGEEFATEDECLSALEAGADDYIKSQYRIKEVLARVQAVLRPIPRREECRRLSIETLAMDLDACRVFGRPDRGSDEVEFHLGPTGFRFLHFLAENPHRVFSRKDIIDNVWFGAAVKEGIVDVYIRALREVLEPLQNSLFIETVRGLGFRLVAATAMVPVEESGQSLDGVSAPGAARRSRRKPLAADRSRVATMREQPVLVSDLGDAIEKIRDLRKLIEQETEENRLLRDAVETARPHASSGAARVRREK